jgi:hypothetical protein
MKVIEDGRSRGEERVVAGNRCAHPGALPA